MREPDTDPLTRFEQTLDPAHPEAGPVPATVLGYGEMSTVLSLDVPELDAFALKRMALFHSEDEVRAYRAAYDAYLDALAARGIRLPDHGIDVVELPDRDLITLYLRQTRLDEATIVNNLIHNVNRDEAIGLLERILTEAAKVFRANESAVELGLDAQISNWAVIDDDALVYFDVTTPLIRIDGDEQLDPELFLRICPSYLVWLVRWFFLDDVVDRYYDFRLVAVDILGNLVKERLEYLIEPGIDLVNRFLAEEPNPAPFEPITEKEVRGYYRQDAFIWRLFLALRRVERWTRTRIRRRPYPMILPGPIDR